MRQLVGDLYATNVVLYAKRRYLRCIKHRYKANRQIHNVYPLIDVNKQAIKFADENFADVTAVEMIHPWKEHVPSLVA